MLSDNRNNFAGETQDINEDCMDHEKKIKGWLPTKESIGSLTHQKDHTVHSKEWLNRPIEQIMKFWKWQNSTIRTHKQFL